MASFRAVGTVTTSPNVTTTKRKLRCYIILCHMLRSVESASGDCLNGGTSVRVASGASYCLCAANYRGKKCEL